MTGQDAEISRFCAGLAAARRAVVAFALAGCMATGLAAPALAQDHVDFSMRFIAEVTDDAVDLLTEPGLSDDELETRLASVLSENLALNNIGRVVVGRYWGDSTDHDRREFLELFKDVTVKSWSGRLGALGGHRFTVIGGQNLPSNSNDVKFAFVKTTFGSGNEQLPVDWRVATANDIYKVTDVFVSGVSLVQTQRDEFEPILRQNGGNLSVLNDILREQKAALN